LTLIIGHIYNLVLHLQGNLLAVGTRDGDVLLWDVAVNGLLSVMKGHLVRVSVLAWNENVVSSGRFDRVILQRDVRTHGRMTDKRLAGISSR
jgi:WD40 repeat protein